MMYIGVKISYIWLGFFNLWYVDSEIITKDKRLLPIKCQDWKIVRGHPHDGWTVVSHVRAGDRGTPPDEYDNSPRSIWDHREQFSAWRFPAQKNLSWIKRWGLGSAQNFYSVDCPRGPI